MCLKRANETTFHLHAAHAFPKEMHVLIVCISFGNAHSMHLKRSFKCMHIACAFPLEMHMLSTCISEGNACAYSVHLKRSFKCTQHAFET